jgi:hypothetical protein
VRDNVDAMLTKVRRKYKEYGINEKPFVVVKADNAAGMGILSVRDVKELDDPEKVAGPGRLRQHRRRRGAERADHPGRRADLRTHERRGGRAGGRDDRPLRRRAASIACTPSAGIDENLGATGSRYVPLAFAGSSQLPKPGVKPGASAPTASTCTASSAAWRCSRRLTSWKRPTRTPKTTSERRCSARLPSPHVANGTSDVQPRPVIGRWARPSTLAREALG